MQIDPNDMAFALDQTSKSLIKYNINIRYYEKTIVLGPVESKIFLPTGERNIEIGRVVFEFIYKKKLYHSCL